MTLKEIEKIIKDFESSELTELELEYEDVKLKLSKNKPAVNNFVNPTNQNVSNTINQPNTENVLEPVVNLPEEQIKSPLVGTFYRASNPEAKPYVNVGDTVKKGQVVCIVEAMKIMNEITATADGVIEQIHFEDGEAVGYNDVLFTVKLNGNKSK